MAISIPIISEFDGKGIAKAKQEFSQLEGAGAKAQYAIKKAAIPAAAALAGVGSVLFSATQAAIEDEGAQKQLALALKNSTGASDAAIAATEDWISAQGRAFGVADDDLRPALAKLSRQTHDVAEAQDAARLAMDISAATGKPLAAVADTLAKAYGGNTKALAKLSPELKSAIDDGMSLDDAMGVLESTFGGASKAAAGTAEGGIKRLKLGLAETKESIGAALLPAIEKLMPYVVAFGDWAQKNTGAFLAIAGAIAAIGGSILVANAAMGIWGTITAITTALNTALGASFTAIQVASGLIVFTAIIAGLAIAYAKFQWFRDGVKAVFEFVKSAISVWVSVIKTEFEIVYGIFKTLFNGIADLWNNTVGKLSFKIPSWVPGVGGKGFDVPNIPKLADGGIVTSPTLALIGEAGPEAVVPLSKAGGMGDTNVTIHVNGGDPNAVVDALRTYMRQNGAVPIRTTGAV